MKSAVKRQMDDVLAQMRVLKTRQADQVRRMREELDRQKNLLKNQENQLESQHRVLRDQEKTLADQKQKMLEEKSKSNKREPELSKKTHSPSASSERFEGKKVSSELPENLHSKSPKVTDPKLLPRAEEKVLPERRRVEKTSDFPERQKASVATDRHASSGEIRTMEQYARYLQPHLRATSPEKGIPLLMPRLDLAGREDLVHLMRYFDFALVAYPADIRKRRFFVEVDLSSPSAKFERRDDFKSLGSRSVISLSGEYFRALKSYLRTRADLCRFQDGELVVSFVPRGAFQTRYLQWKMLKVCRENGYEPVDVSHCAGTFRRTSFGAWVFLVEDLVTRKGRSVRVQDFEYSKVFGS
ncbi:MAG: hypothetical protein QF752_05620 [Planctomycetota bacterium]|nr:hypothetical protein [Planctomycetota bacterium]